MKRAERTMNNSEGVRSRQISRPLLAAHFCGIMMTKIMRDRGFPSEKSTE